MSASASHSSCILFQSQDKTVALVDIPRSLEEAQVSRSDSAPSGRRIVSAKPVSKPFPTPEPKHADSSAQRRNLDPTSSLAELMTGAAVESALSTLRESHHGPCCLERLESAQIVPHILPKIETTPGDSCASQKAKQQQQSQEQGSEPKAISSPDFYIPEKSHYLHGTIEDKRDDFLASAPSFDLIVLDPPWPNRSAKRKRAGHNSDSSAYTTVSGIPETRNLLGRIPVSERLAPNGLVAVWVTNKPSLVDLLVNPRDGVLTSWGLEVAAEWTWLKVTSEGEPLYDIESTWRKPWERLILAKRPGSRAQVLSSKVIVAVPDLHSRKPNLRGFFEEGVFSNGFAGLEVFARNLTAGWWSWGDEVLRFQTRESWVDGDAGADEIEQYGKEKDHT